jgi:hypothetical protein
MRPSAAELVIRSTGAGLFITAPVTLFRVAGPSITVPVDLFRPVARITFYFTEPATGGQEGRGSEPFFSSLSATQIVS